MSAKQASAALDLARTTIAVHGKSFALAARLLPASLRDEACVLYAYCRRADDAIDLAPRAEQPLALEMLRAELDAIYLQRNVADPIAAAFARLVHARGIPRAYPEALLRGMHMDVVGVRYESLGELTTYAYRVAGTVGLMMCHVMGVRSERALLHAAHLGIAMQLTNIARDVHEDWQRGRLYLPRALCAPHGAGTLHEALGMALPARALLPVAHATAELLEHADQYYRSADAGLVHLSPQCAFAIRSARLIYAEIGAVLRRRACVPSARRAVVGMPRKLVLVARAAGETLARLPFSHPAPLRVPRTRVDELALRSLS
jgi:phytoene synthase